MSLIKQTGLDKLSDYLSPAIRKMEDFQFGLTGTRVQVIRIKRETKEAWAGNSGRDIFGDSDERFEAEVFDNLIIKYPFQKVEIFGNKIKHIQQTKTLNPEGEIPLPIEFFIKFSGDYDTTSVSIDRGDLVVDYFKDEHGTIIPIFLEVSQLFATFSGKNIVRKTGTLVPYRGDFEKSIEDRVVLYLAMVENMIQLTASSQIISSGTVSVSPQTSTPSPIPVLTPDNLIKTASISNGSTTTIDSISVIIFKSMQWYCEIVDSITGGVSAFILQAAKVDSGNVSYTIYGVAGPDSIFDETQTQLIVSGGLVSLQVTNNHGVGITVRVFRRSTI